MPEISIILPSYNVEKYISKALESCINQSLKDIEIIVVDDDSSDESLKIAKEFAKSDKRIKIFQHQTNQGTFLARKTGIMKASAEIVIFLDGDDFLHLQACELVYHSVLNGGGGDMDLLCYEYTQNQNKKYHPNEAMQVVSKDEFFYEWIKTKAPNSLNSLCNKAFKRTLLIKALEYLADFKNRLLMAEDILLISVYLAFVNKIGSIKKVLYYYTLNENSITQKSSQKQKADFEKTKLSLENLTCVILFLKEYCKAYEGMYFFALRLIINNLTIHQIDTKYKILATFPSRLLLKIQRKIVKFQRNKTIKMALKLYQQGFKDVSYNL